MKVGSAGVVSATVQPTRRRSTKAAKISSELAQFVTTLSRQAVSAVALPRATAARLRSSKEGRLVALLETHLGTPELCPHPP